jgi:hypothetical protein
LMEKTTFRYREASKFVRFAKYSCYCLDQIKNEKCGADSMHTGIAYKILVGNPKGEGLIPIFRHKLEDKNGMNVKTCTSSVTEYGLRCSD